MKNLPLEQEIGSTIYPNLSITIFHFIKYAIKERLKPQISKVLRNWSVFSLQSKKKSLEKE